MQTITGLWVTEQYYSFFETTKNGLLFGFPYISLGAFLAEKQAKKAIDMLFSNWTKPLRLLTICMVVGGSIWPEPHISQMRMAAI